MPTRRDSQAGSFFLKLCPEVPRARRAGIDDPPRSGEHELNHGHPTWQLLINSNRLCRWNTDSIESMIRWPARAMQNMRVKVERRNIHIFHRLPLPPSSARLGLRLRSFGILRCVNRCQHHSHLLCQRLSFVRCGVHLFLRHDLAEHNQCVGTPQALCSCNQKRRCEPAFEFVTEYQRFVEAPWPAAARTFHSVFIVGHICPRVHVFLGTEVPLICHSFRQCAEAVMR